jgi:ABC-2 type transport system permease protein
MRAVAPSQGSAVRTAGGLAGRSIMLIPRVPSTFVPSLIFPIFITVSFSGAFDAVTRLPNFPTDQMINWVLPMSIIQGAAFAGITSGLGVARDLEVGFYDRLLLAPVKPLGLLAGPLLASMLRSLIPFFLVLAAGLLAGADFPGGVAGLGTLLLAGAGTALVAGGWGLGLAYRIKSMSAAPLMQVGLFLTFFLSTAQVPLSVMTGWLHAVARVNPMTNVLALGRQGFLGPVTWEATWPGLVVLAGAGILLTAFAYRGLSRLAD